MSWRRAFVTPTFPSTAVVGALTAAALTAGTLAGAPSANATCASFFGIGNSAQCTSTPFSIAIALGNNAVANASGLFGAAFAIGDNTSAVVHPTAPLGIAATLGGIADTFTPASIALAVGPGSFANATSGTAPFLGGNTAIALGGTAIAGGLGNFATSIGSSGTTSALGVANVGIKLLNAGGLSSATGTGNLAVLAFGNGGDAFTNGSVNAVGAFFATNGTARAYGNLNTAVTLGGTDATADAGSSGTPSTATSAFNVFGTSSTAITQGGPLAIAGSIAQDTAFIKKVGPGININGFVVGGASAVRPTSSAPAAKASAAASTGSNRAGTRRSGSN